MVNQTVGFNSTDLLSDSCDSSENIWFIVYEYIIGFGLCCFMVGLVGGSIWLFWFIHTNRPTTIKSYSDVQQIQGRWQTPSDSENNEDVSSGTMLSLLDRS